MTMTPERLAELDVALARFPISLPWYSGPTERDGTTGIHGEPYPVGDMFAVAYLADVFGDAAPVVEAMNMIPDLRAHIDAQAATIAGLRDALLQAAQFIEVVANADFDEIAADGGIDVGMVIQKQAATVNGPRARAALNATGAA